MIRIPQPLVNYCLIGKVLQSKKSQSFKPPSFPNLTELNLSPDEIWLDLEDSAG